MPQDWATACPGCRREVQQGRNSCAGSCIFLNLKLGQKLQLDGWGHDVHVWKKDVSSSFRAILTLNYATFCFAISKLLLETLILFH